MLLSGPSALRGERAIVVCAPRYGKARHSTEKGRIAASATDCRLPARTRASIVLGRLALLERWTFEPAATWRTE
jgi:hypothetical protein